MDLLQVYHKVNGILNDVCFDALFEGFHKYRFALYNSREIILDDQILPPRDDFRGNTAKEYEGEYIAIWNMEFDPVEDEERLAYCLVHEMFHCHQHVNKETRFPSDLDLLDYPEDVENFTKKYNENRYLTDAYEQKDMELMRKFVSIRKSRHEKYSAVISQEWKVETLEGMAEYIGLKALKQINEEKYTAIVSDYIEKLREESNLLFDIRRISYYTGAVYFLCLDRLGMSVRNNFDTELTAFEQNPVDTKEITADITSFDFIPKKYGKVAAEKKSMIKKYMENAKYTECQAFICGYDPMNMLRQGDLIYCKHFVCLNENGEVKMFRSAVVLKLAEDSNSKVTGYYSQW